MSRPHLTVDARMLFFSGIGSVIQNIVARLPDRLPTWRITLLTGQLNLSAVSKLHPALETRIVKSSIYSLQEQIEIPWHIAGDVTVHWSPHFNIPLNSNTPLVTTVHDLCHLAHPEYFPGRLRRHFAHLLIARALLRSSYILTVSDFTRNEIFRLFPEQSHSKVKRVYSGVDLSWTRNPSRTEKSHPPYFLCIGNVKPHKNLSRLIQAYLTCRHQIPHHLKIVADPSATTSTDRDAIALAKRHPERIHFTGKLTSKILQQTVTAADALIFPSIYEGFGLPPLEAMACGCPTAIADIPVLREIYEDNFATSSTACRPCSLFFNPYSTESIAAAIHSLANLSPKARAELVKNGTDLVKKYSWNTTADQYAKCFKSVSQETYLTP